MTKQEHATKLRLIADIIEKDLPFELSFAGRPFAAPIHRAGYYSDVSDAIIRIKPEPAPPVLIPLGPEDVPPGSILHHVAANGGDWYAITQGARDGIHLAGRFTPWMTLTDDYLIKRPGEDWQPCHKVQS